MNLHEKQFVAAFILPEKRDRYTFLLESPDPRRRGECTNRLNHCNDFDPRFTTWLARNPRRSPLRNAEIAASLRKKGSPDTVYVFANDDKIDGKMFPLEDALNRAEEAGWGAVVSCVPGRLAYYIDEEAENRAIFEKAAPK